MPLSLATSSFEISLMNPLQFFDRNFVNLPQYMSKHFDDVRYPYSNPAWVEAPFWKRMWQQTDRLQLQVFSQVGPVKATLISTYDGAKVYSQNLVQKQQALFQSGWFIYELDWDLSIFTAGYEYEIELQFGTGTGAITVVSNQFELHDTIEDSYLVEFSHYREKDGIYFETGFKTQIRTLGSLVLENQGSSNVVYIDQENDATEVSSKSWNLYRFYVGDSGGIPDFEVARWRMILGCYNLKIDGREYTRASSDAQFEPKIEDGYALKGWSIQLRDKLNRSARKWSTAGDFAQQGLNAVITVETKGFVSDDNGGSYYNVSDID